MPDLKDGESMEMQGSGSRPYVLKNVGGVYSCTCPAWRNQSLGIERRTCKHLRKLRGDAAEEARIGNALPAQAQKAAKERQAPPLLLAEAWDCVLDPTGWWLSEKARRRSGLLGRPAILFAAGKSLSRPGLVCRGIAQRAAGRRACGWAGNCSSERSASCAARTRATTGRMSALSCSMRRPWRRTSRPGWSSFINASKKAIPSMPRPTPTNRAKVSTTCVGSWLVWKPGSRRVDDAPGQVEV